MRQPGQYIVDRRLRLQPDIGPHLALRGKRNVARQRCMLQLAIAGIARQHPQARGLGILNPRVPNTARPEDEAPLAGPRFRLFHALIRLLQAFYTVRSKRQLMEPLNYNLLFAGSPGFPTPRECVFLALEIEIRRPATGFSVLKGLSQQPVKCSASP